MDEILLTDSAIDSLLERAWVEVYGGTERVDRQRTKEVMQTAQLLCRAQVRKVAWWSEGECKHDSKRIRRCCDLCWRDVKAAGGEG